MDRSHDPPAGAGDATRDGLIAGSPEAVETVRRWAASVVHGGRWSLADRDGAVQEIAARILHLARDGRIRAGADFRSFVLMVSRHTCVDLYRRERLRRSFEEPDPPLEDRAAPGEDPHAALERRERLDRLRYVVQAIPEECRRLWRWAYAEGLSGAEIGRRLGITEGNARVRLHRCARRARRIWDEYEP
jgi:RNA polymerase sigma factor (sigma-70 family)